MWPVKEGFYRKKIKGAAINSNLFPECFNDLSILIKKNNFISSYFYLNV